jgi:hypothetical protein
MLVTALNDPVAPPLAQAALRAVDPRFHLRWVSGVMRYWAICEHWRDNDPRRERIKQGEITPDAAWDVIAFLPLGCSAEEVEGYVLREFERVSDPKKQAAEQVDAIEKANNANKAKIVDAFTEEQGEKGLRTTKHDLLMQAGLETANAQIIVPKTFTGGKKK